MFLGTALADLGRPRGHQMGAGVNYRTRREGVVNLIGTGRALDAKGLESIRGSVGTNYTVIEGGL